MLRYFIKLAYKGTAYHGWQIQKNAHTVQAELNEKIGLLLGENVNVIGCGRTDAGVHAREFYAHIDISKKASNTINTIGFINNLNKFLPSDIVIFSIQPVLNDFHARFSAISRTYRYYILQKKDPFMLGFGYYYTGNLDICAMQTATNFLLEYTDFTSFSKLHTQTNTNNCNIMFANWEKKNDILIFTITADRFLRNMVRAIVGTVLEIGRGKISPQSICSIIESKNRGEAGFSVPAHGLFLEKIKYPFDI